MAKKFVVGAAIGGAVGAIAALLFAPKKGSELRKDIKEKADGLVDKSAGIREKGSEWVSIAVEKGTEMKDQVVSKGQDLKGKILKKDLVQQAVDRVEDIVEEVQEEMEEVQASDS